MMQYSYLLNRRGRPKEDGGFASKHVGNEYLIGGGFVKYGTIKWVSGWGGTQAINCYLEDGSTTGRFWVHGNADNMKGPRNKRDIYVHARVFGLRAWA